MKNIIKQIKKLLNIKSKEAALLLGLKEPVLLLELLEKYPDYFETGLCYFVYILLKGDKITRGQYRKLVKWIDSNFPKNRKAISTFWFKSGDKEARIKYLKTFV